MHLINILVSVNEKVMCKTSSGNEYCGIIKYIGSLAVSPGTSITICYLTQLHANVYSVNCLFVLLGMWIGIDIGCAEGKNDGSIQGKKYFDCSPNHGIFVKESAVTKFVENPKNIEVTRGETEAGSAIDSEKESNFVL